MSRDTIKYLIDLIPEQDIETIYRVLIRFVPEVQGEPGELEALLEGREDRRQNGTVAHNEINWD